MENLTTYRNLYWDLKKSAYAEINDLPFMEAPGSVLMIMTAYLAFVLRIGPAFMRKRQPYKLATTMLIYNAVQVVFSAYLVQRMYAGFLAMFSFTEKLTFFRNILFDSGIFPKQCYLTNEDSRKEIIYGTWLYFCAKITELADTIFFVLRKKDRQVTFLHLYHHTIMMFGTWAVLKYWPTQALLFTGFLNSLVHVFMYTYYGLAGLGPKVTKYLTWKKYLTTFQLIQFVSIIIQYWIAINRSECPQHKSFNIFVMCNTAFFLLLFSNFYRKNYSKTNKD